MHVRFRCLLNLGGQPAAVLLCSALLGACRWKLHALSAVDAASCANVVARRVYMSETTFREWLKIKEGRGCSEEVVAKGKGHARKTGRRRRGRAHRRPIREQSVSYPPLPNTPVQWSGTALPPMGVSWVWQGTVSAWHVSLGFHAGSRFLIFFFDLCDHCRWKQIWSRIFIWKLH